MAEQIYIRIELGNDAMCTPGDVAGALRKLADRIESREAYDHIVRDENGNKVGESVQLEEE